MNKKHDSEEVLKASYSSNNSCITKQSEDQEQNVIIEFSNYQMTNDKKSQNTVPMPNQRTLFDCVSNMEKQIESKGSKVLLNKNS